MSEPAPRLNTALIVSLCVNLLLAGVIATAMYRFAAHPPGPAPQPPQAAPSERVQVRQLMSPKFLSHISPEQAAKIRQVAEAHHPKLERLKADAQAARQDLLKIFSAPELDQTALKNGFAKMQAADIAIGTEFTKVALEIAPMLSPEERKKAAEWQSHHGPFGPMGWRPGPPPGREGDSHDRDGHDRDGAREGHP
ncbi:putative membrane protein [Rhizomicrobium palustre]|uniref:Putative membrane protein n=1 Tax=Rhizomicrobium palustre TaxID=189966 RepID=A0A846MZI9_9PROT|nr:periplasmic heavy metal sensor [Rhizomicrobium palustre]NIK88856.1 putative membrane protein [Rhizomicrobium palustre]